MFFTAAILLAGCTTDGLDNISPASETNTAEASSPGETVLKAFAARFPQAADVKWSDKGSYPGGKYVPDYFMAAFSEGGISKNAIFTPAGDWMQTISSASTQDLPEAVTASFSGDPAFTGLSISGASTLERQGLGMLYIVRLTDGSGEANVYCAGNGKQTRYSSNTSAARVEAVDDPEKISSIVSALYEGSHILDAWQNSYGYYVFILDAESTKIVTLDSNYEHTGTFVNLDEKDIPQNVMDRFKLSDYGQNTVLSYKSQTGAAGTSYLFYFNADNKSYVVTINPASDVTLAVSHNVNMV